jgi:anti-sigma factor RsiW
MHPTDLQLNEYADETIAPEERPAVDRHLRECDRCRGLVADIGEIRRAAAALPTLAPPPRAWDRIEQQLGTSQPGRTVLYRPYWLGAAAALVLAALVTVLWNPFARGGVEQASVGADDPSAAALAESVEAELEQAEQHYQRAIAGLEQIARTEQGELDPQTAALLQKNLAVIDQAISESRAALKVEPESQPAQQSLLESFKQKVALLQNTVALINEMRKGDEAGAARVVSGLR